MDTDIQFLLLFVIGYIAYLLYKNNKKSKAKKLTKLYLDHIDNFKFDVLKSFSDYLLTNKILVYENEVPVILKSKKYIHSNLESAFLEIKNKLLTDFNNKMFLPNGDVLEDFYLEINNIYKNDNEIQKLRYINNSIKYISINVAIENYNSSIFSDHAKSIGAQFIALRTFENETKVGRFYPEDDYRKLRRLLKKRKKNSTVSYDEFLETFT
ncbi:hypothetical protein H4K35_00040 [Myroides sp. NP-2]|uniref:hypothetical protein n=1 Tax=Myroides sp. NP-2 TaxID=2759945 RepID=UPI0015FBA12C|nr:hypothetical protein [Myroides sp. NP-2]MBB1148537.1 hypothetical protein [Myroides sp. NP-2]